MRNKESTADRLEEQTERAEGLERELASAREESARWRQGHARELERADRLQRERDAMRAVVEAALVVVSLHLPPWSSDIWGLAAAVEAYRRERVGP